MPSDDVRTSAAEYLSSVSMVIKFCDGRGARVPDSDVAAALFKGV